MTSITKQQILIVESNNSNAIQKLLIQADIACKIVTVNEFIIEKRNDDFDFSKLSLVKEENFPNKNWWQKHNNKKGKPPRY